MASSDAKSSDPTPRQLAGLVGQQRAVETIQSALTTRQIPPGWLFAGPVGVGKLTAARIAAAAANCLGNEPVSDGGLFGGPPAPAEGALPQDACGTCASCRKIAGGNHPDVRIISKAQRAAETGKRVRDLTIEQVRPLLSDLAFRPYEGRHRFFIFDDAHDLNASAQNALLKSLEEPPPSTTFVLVTDRPAALLPTVISRSRIVRFRPIPPDDAATLIARVLETSPAEARVLAAAAGGSVGRALRDDGSLYRRESRQQFLEEALGAARAGGGSLLETAEDWARRGEELPPLLHMLAAFFRDARVRGIQDPIHADLDELIASATTAGAPALDRCFAAVRTATAELRGAAQDTRLVLEHMLYEIGAALTR